MSDLRFRIANPQSRNPSIRDSNRSSISTTCLFKERYCLLKTELCDKLLSQSDFLRIGSTSEVRFLIPDSVVSP